MNSFGRLFRIHIYGESHGSEVGMLIDGCPAGFLLSPDDFLNDLQRRRAGAIGTTARKETDIPELASGLFEGRTTGAPILIRFPNRDVQSGDYRGFHDLPRPGHTDFVADQKFAGFHDFRGGGTFSGRLTVGLTAAGVIAKKLIAPIGIEARLTEVGGSEDISGAIAEAVTQKDSLGGIIECRASGVPAGLGEPFFDSVESLLSHLLFAIPGIKGVEFGAGFSASRMQGSQFNDQYLNREGTTLTNHSGGINGGISNGNEIFFRVGVRPTASIGRPQKTIHRRTGEEADITISGRHDTCFALRVPVIIEAAAAIVLADLLLLEQRLRRTGQRKDYFKEES